MLSCGCPEWSHACGSSVEEQCCVSHGSTVPQLCQDGILHQNDNDTQGDVFTRQPCLSRSLHNTYISSVRQKLQPSHSVIISSVCYEHQLSVGNLKLPVSMITSTFCQQLQLIVSHSISRVFWAPNGTRLSARCHFTGPKKLSISRAQPPPTCLSYGCCPHEKHYARGRINHRCINSYYQKIQRLHGPEDIDYSVPYLIAS
jgi:hypothetical protein